MRFIRGSGWEQLLSITIGQLVSFFWPSLQFDTFCTWPCPTSSEPYPPCHTQQFHLCLPYHTVPTHLVKRFLSLSQYTQPRPPFQCRSQPHPFTLMSNKSLLFISTSWSCLDIQWSTWFPSSYTRERGRNGGGGEECMLEIRPNSVMNDNRTENLFLSSGHTPNLCCLHYLMNQPSWAKSTPWMVSHFDP